VFRKQGGSTKTVEDDIASGIRTIRLKSDGGTHAIDDRGIVTSSSNTDTFTMYFVNLQDETFRQTVGRPKPNGTNTTILADSVTNTIAFSAQNFSGQVQTNKLNNRVIHLTLDFYQPELFMRDPDNYQLETSVTRRALHWPSMHDQSEDEGGHAPILFGRIEERA